MRRNKIGSKQIASKTPFVKTFNNNTPIVSTYYINNRRSHLICKSSDRVIDYYCVVNRRGENLITIGYLRNPHWFLCIGTEILVHVRINATTRVIQFLSSFKFQSLLVIGTICAFDHIQNIYKSWQTGFQTVHNIKN